MPNELNQDDIDTLKRDGICLKSAFFSHETVDVLRTASLTLREFAPVPKRPSRRWILRSPVDGIRKSLNSDSRRAIYQISRVIGDSGFRRSSELFFRAPVELDHIMSIESPVSDEPITKWHTDSNSRSDHPDSFTLKFFIYLNSIDESNGAFAYVRGTQSIVTVIRQGIFEGRVEYVPTGSVAELLTAVSDSAVSKYLNEHVSECDLELFRQNLLELNDQQAGDRRHDLVGPAGTLLVFDDRGVHRGGVPRVGPRSILRVNYMATQFAPSVKSRKLRDDVAKMLLRGPMRNHW